MTCNGEHDRMEEKKSLRWIELKEEEMIFCLNDCVWLEFPFYSNSTSLLRPYLCTGPVLLKAQLWGNQQNQVCTGFGHTSRAVIRAVRFGNPLNPTRSG